jgi:hypothetical protein
MIMKNYLWTIIRTKIYEYNPNYNNSKLLVELFDVLNANIYKLIVFCYAIIWKIKLFV